MLFCIVVSVVLYLLGMIIVMAWRGTENSRARLANPPEKPVEVKLAIAIACGWPAVAAWLGVMMLFDEIKKL